MSAHEWEGFELEPSPLVDFVSANGVPVETVIAVNTVRAEERAKREELRERLLALETQLRAALATVRALL